MTKLGKVVVVGGGTGSFAILQAIKNYANHITALVNMSDDGGSTGTLRDELGVLPPGDVRQCLVALSDASAELRQLFNYRFERGALNGHSFGNIFLSAVEKMAGNFGDAVRMAGEVLQIKGRVVPITLDNVRLEATLGDGSSLRGEHQVDSSQLQLKGKKPWLEFSSSAQITPEASQAIKAADLIVIAPGDIYTSLGPILIVEGVADALHQSRAQVVYVCNLVTKPGHTDGFSVADHAAEIERFAGGPVLDYVFYNTARPRPELFEKYKRGGELLVNTEDLGDVARHYRAVGLPLLAPSAAEQVAGDALGVTRSFIRHDGTAVATALLEL